MLASPHSLPPLSPALRGWAHGLCPERKRRLGAAWWPAEAILAALMGGLWAAMQGSFGGFPFSTHSGQQGRRGGTKPKPESSPRPQNGVTAGFSVIGPHRIKATGGSGEKTTRPIVHAWRVRVNTIVTRCYADMYKQLQSMHFDTKSSVTRYRRAWSSRQAQRPFW
jgi:hypothetical protein